MPKNEAPLFTRRHYEAVAETFNDLYNGGQDEHNLDVILSRFVGLFENDNVHFNKTRFITAAKTSK